MRRFALIFLPYIWLLALFLVPFLIVIKISLSDIATAIPPYTPTLDFSQGWQGIKAFFSALDFENFTFLTTDDLYWKSYISSLQIAFFATLLTLLVGYPIAYGMANAPDHWRPTLMMLVILPFWTSFLIRVYSWMGILSTEGYLNQVLLKLGVISEPLIILNTPTAVYIGIVYTYLPFMKTGIIAGCFLVFIPVIGEFVIPSLLGGSQTLMIGKVLWEEFFNNRDWPVASALAIVMLLLLLVPIVLFHRFQAREMEKHG